MKRQHAKKVCDACFVHQRDKPTKSICSRTSTGHPLTQRLPPLERTCRSTVLSAHNVCFPILNVPMQDAERALTAHGGRKNKKKKLPPQGDPASAVKGNLPYLTVRAHTADAMRTFFDLLISPHTVFAFAIGQKEKGCSAAPHLLLPDRQLHRLVTLSRNGYLGQDRAQRPRSAVAQPIQKRKRKRKEHAAAFNQICNQHLRATQHTKWRMTLPTNSAPRRLHQDSAKSDVGNVANRVRNASFGHVSVLLESCGVCFPTRFPQCNGRNHSVLNQHYY